jgi:hypothetical protein
LMFPRFLFVSLPASFVFRLLRKALLFRVMKFLLVHPDCF